MGRTFGVVLLSGVMFGSSAAVIAQAQADQKPLTFEVASVKPHTTSGVNERSGVEETQGLVRVENLPLRALIEEAYGVMDYQFSGPSWLDSERYQIVAKPGRAGYTRSDYRSMLQNLLADRFKLVVHHESKQVGAYELVVVKTGSKLHESTGPRTFFTARPGLISGTRASTRELAAALSRLLHRPTTDQTELAGVYDVKLEWTPDSATGDLGTSIFTALQEQLGLKLESTKAPVDVIVVDHVERPAPD
jgi:uncharacterized protein (TIGR03435 family)